MPQILEQLIKVVAAQRPRLIPQTVGGNYDRRSNLDNMNKKILLITLAINILSCGDHEKELHSIPLEFQGEWIDHESDTKLIILDTIIYRIFDVSNRPDTNYNKITSISKRGRKECDDCLPYGLHLKFDSERVQEEIFYLDFFHPELDMYLKLNEIEKFSDPDYGRGYIDRGTWTRHLINIEDNSKNIK